MDNFLVVAKQVGVFYALILAGVVCRRTRLLDEPSVRGIVNILVVVVTPAVVIDSFCRPFDQSMLRQLGLAAVVAVVAHLVAIAGACLAFRGGGRALPVLRDAPVAAIVAMFSAKYDRDVNLSVGLVSGTTLLSTVTMPVVIAVAMRVL